MKTDSPGQRELGLAAAASLAEITRLAATARPKIAALAVYIRDHLFDPQLSVRSVKEACQSRDNSIALNFHRQLGKPPGAFITDYRLAIAERLLSETLLPVWKITELLGYSSIQVFSRAYFRRKGRRPTSVRRQRSSEAPKAISTSEPPPEPDLLRRALAGQLEDREVLELVSRLLEIYPPHWRSSPQQPVAQSGLGGRGVDQEAVDQDADVAHPVPQP